MKRGTGESSAARGGIRKAPGRAGGFPEGGEPGNKSHRNDSKRSVASNTAEPDRAPGPDNREKGSTTPKTKPVVSKDKSADSQLVRPPRRENLIKSRRFTPDSCVTQEARNTNSNEESFTERNRDSLKIMMCQHQAPGGSQTKKTHLPSSKKAQRER